MVACATTHACDITPGTTEAAVTHQDQRTELQISWDAGNPEAGRPGLGLLISSPTAGICVTLTRGSWPEELFKSLLKFCPSGCQVDLALPGVLTTQTRSPVKD